MLIFSTHSRVTLPQHLRIHTMRKSALPAPRGFALVVTVSLMILLALVAVGFLSLSAVSLRSSSPSLAQEEVKANARLALMLAIGELQKQLGPDQRITANGAIGMCGSWKTTIAIPDSIAFCNKVVRTHFRDATERRTDRETKQGNSIGFDRSSIDSICCQKWPNQPAETTKPLIIKVGRAGGIRTHEKK